MNGRISAVPWIRLVVVALAGGLLAAYLANMRSPLATQAQSPLPTNTPTPTPAEPTPTDTPTPTPAPPTPTNTPLPPTPTNTPVPLDCSHPAPSIAVLWPPNHGFVTIRVLGVQGGVTLVIDSIFQDEPVHTPGSGSSRPDGHGVGSSMAQVRAERAGGGNGRVYHIAFTASDGHGRTCSGEVLVSVPQSQSRAAVDDGALYDSTAAIPWP